MAILAMAPGVNTLILESTYCLLHEIALCSTSTQRAAMTLHILVPEIAIDLTAGLGSGNLGKGLRLFLVV
jgi:hypothetical protein